MTGLFSGSVAGSASNSGVEIFTGCGASVSTPSARATALLERSISDRWPFQMMYVLSLCSASTAFGGSRGSARAPTASGPPIAVTRGAAFGLSGALSHTVHSELSAVRSGMAAGALAMPTEGPCGYFASSLALTKVGLFA